MRPLDRGAAAIALMLGLVAAFAGLLALSAVAHGQGHEIRIVSSVATSDFPNNVTFRLTAVGPDPIEEVRVFLKPVGGERSTYGYMDIEPGRQVSGEYVMPTGSGSTHKPPGTVIRYSYEIRDQAGRVLRTDEEEFLYMDYSLEWKSISEGLLTVYYYGAFVERRAETVLQAAKDTLEKMGPVLGISPKAPINIVSYSNYRDMTRALPFRSQAVQDELQTEGTAWPSERVLLVLSSGTDVTGVASHEFTHILLAEAAGLGYGAVPAWLNEGLAEYGNLDETPFYDRALAYAVYTRRLKPLWYLDRFTGEPDDIVIAYGQGKSVVQYLVNVYGEGKITELMRAFAETLTTDQALLRVYGLDQYGVDSEWRRSLGIDPLPPPGELEGRLTPAPDSDPTPVPETEPSPVPTDETRGTPVPITEAVPMPAGEATPAPAAEATPQAVQPTETGRRTSRSCGGASGESAGLMDIATIALLGGPLLALGMGRGLARQRFLSLRGVVRRLRRVTEKLNGPAG